MEFPYGWKLFNQNPIIEISFMSCGVCFFSLIWFEWMWCSWMMVWLWCSCPTQQLQPWLLSFWMSHCLVRMMLHVKTLVCSGGRGSACTAQMLRMMSSTLYHADLISFFHPLSTTTTTTTLFPWLMQIWFLTFFFNFLVKTLFRFHSHMFGANEVKNVPSFNSSSSHFSSFTSSSNASLFCFRNSVLEMLSYY